MKEIKIDEDQLFDPYAFGLMMLGRFLGGVCVGIIIYSIKKYRNER